MSTRRERILDTVKKAGLDGVIFATGPNLQYVSECEKYFWQRSCMNNIGGAKSSHILPEAVLFLTADNECTIVAIPRISLLCICTMSSVFAVTSSDSWLL